MRRRPSRLLVAALSSAGALAIVVAAELLVRAAAPSGPRPFAFAGLAEEEFRDGLLREDPRTAYALAPHYRSSELHAGRYATGRWPYRNRPAEPALPGTVRVVVLGDSCVYGVGVAAAETLPARIQEGLDARGHSPLRVQILNLGVPGFSTAQIARRLEDALAELRPAAVVLYPAAWNDQAPALGRSDDEVLARLSGPGALLRASALYRSLARWEERTETHVEELVAAWRRGEPRHGTRVPADEVGPNVARMLSLCAAARTPAVVVLPAHPRSSRELHPRLARDRESVRRAVLDAEDAAALVDADGVLAATGLPEGALFVDHVHPSAAGHRALGDAVADELAARLAAPPTPVGGDGVRLLSFSPRTLSALGDERLEVELAGFDGAEGTPVLLVGHAPLLDVERLGPGRFAGTTIANRAGPEDVLVQSESGATRIRDALRFLPPRIEARDVAGGSPLAFASRPGDRALVVVATEILAEPVHDELGTAWLDPTAVVASYGPLEAGPDGTVALPLAAEDLERAGELWFQALVTPRGEPRGSRERRYGELFAWRPGGPPAGGR